MRSRFFRTLLVCAAIGGLLLHRADTVRAVSSGVVISQVYGGGGNSGAPWRNDFIELFNRGTSPVSLNGWSVQYTSAAGTSTWLVTNLTNVTLAPGQYYLVQEAAGANLTAPSLPTPDVTGSIAMSATNAKLALVSNTTALSGGCPSSAAIVDLVGYGTGASAPSCFEGTPAPTLSNTTADIRAVHGCHRDRQQRRRFRQRRTGTAEYGDDPCAVWRRRHRAQRQQHDARRRRDQRLRQLDDRDQLQRERERVGQRFQSRMPGRFSADASRRARRPAPLSR